MFRKCLDDQINLIRIWRLINQILLKHCTHGSKANEFSRVTRSQLVRSRLMSGKFDKHTRMQNKIEEKKTKFSLNIILLWRLWWTLKTCYHSTRWQQQKLDYWPLNYIQARNHGTFQLSACCRSWHRSGFSEWWPCILLHSENAFNQFLEIHEGSPTWLNESLQR